MIRNKSCRHSLILCVGLSVTLLSILTTVIAADRAFLQNTMIGGGNNLYMDFMNHIRYVREPSKVYYSSPDAVFPPLAYIMYYLFGRMLAENQIITDIGNQAFFFYQVCFTVSAVLLLHLVYRILNRYSDRFRLLFALMLSLSFIFTTGPMERGNSVILVLVMLLGAMVLRDSETGWKREAALILIAAAAGFKVYPAVFGALYLLEKRYKEALRLILYGVILFFVPFVFFGGLDGLRQFFANQGVLHGRAVYFNFYARIISILQALGMSDGAAGILGKILFASGLLLALAALVKTKKNYVRCTLLTGAMVFLPMWSGEYTMIYFVLPALYFMREEEDGSIRNKVMDALYGVYFALPYFGMIPFLADYGKMNMLNAHCLYLIIALCILDAFAAKDSFRIRDLRKRFI